MATTTQRPAEEIEPYHEQEPFLWDKHRYYGFISGVGAGKTGIGGMRTALNAEYWNRGEMGAIVAPSTRMIKNAIFPVMKEFGLRQRWKFTGFQAEEPGFHTPDGGRIVILSASDERTIERLAGLNLAFWWLDEAKETPKRARDILRERLRKGDYQNGYITTTPNGEDHNYDFFKGDPEADGELETYDWGKGTIYEGYDDRLCIAHVPSWANPHNPDEFKEEMRSLPDEIRRQQAEGLFVERKGLVYGWFDPQKHVTPYDPEESPPIQEAIQANPQRYLYGVDWGRTHPFAIVVIAETDTNELVIVDEVYQTGLDYNEMVSVAQNLQERYSPGRWYCDPAEPAAIDMFQKAGLDATDAENAILPGIQYVSAQRDRLRILSRCENTIAEFRSYHYPDGVDDETPVDANNHLLDSIRYCLFTDTGGPSVGMAGMDFV